MPGETTEQLKARTGKIIALLRKAYPGARSALNWSTPLELLIATILSAQTTDAGVNRVTEKLFRKYKSAQDWAGADPAVLEQELRPTGFYRNKTKSVQGACRVIVERHGGKVPGEMKQLVELPGVARKTASVVLGNAFGVPSIAVDRHVVRVAGRLGLTRSAKPERIEQNLMAAAPKNDWIHLGHALVLHGRQVCTARKPRCADCALNKLCPSAFRV